MIQSWSDFEILLNSGYMCVVWTTKFIYTFSCSNSRNLKFSIFPFLQIPTQEPVKYVRLFLSMQTVYQYNVELIAYEIIDESKISISNREGAVQRV